MAIPSFPIPEPKPTVQQVDERLQLQSDVLEGLYATAQAAVDSRINSQAAVLNSAANTAVRAVDRRIRSQSKLLEPVISTAIQTVDDAIARQGAQLAIHSEVFPRIYPTPQDTPSSLGPAYAPVFPAPTGASAQTGIGQSSGEPGSTPGSGRSVGYAVLVDCDKRSLGVFDLTNFLVQLMVQNGHFVPIRYGTKDDLESNFLGVLLPRLVPLQAGWIARACNAYNNDGAGWPVNGDFMPTGPDNPYYGQGLPETGEPVGDWPFPR